jgi:hypothetical protein
MGLYGKGYFIWQIPRCEGGDPAAIAARAIEAGLSHVLIKIADGPDWAYNYDLDRGVDLIPPVVGELRNAGIEAWGWHYIMGDDPVGEARIAVERTRGLGLDGYVLDAEAQYKRSGKTNAARRFMSDLRAGLPNLPIALSSYRYPRVHRELPFEAFLEGCDFAMPQVYFEMSHNPEQQLERSVEEYLSLRPARPVIPTAPTYASGPWRPSADEVRRLLQRAKDMGLTAANAWSWDYARKPAYLDLWRAVADFDWAPVAPVADIPERLFGRMNQLDPNHVAELYADRAAHVTGARTVLGKPSIKAWYQNLFSQMLPNAEFELTGKSGSGHSRHFTWRARSERGEVRDGNDILGLLDGKIHYHYTYFTVMNPA